jgi:signal transduction histidine kinase/ligand-binding sensor domain-containing protein/DNA-binding response OmpR family regulator
MKIARLLTYFISLLLAEWVVAQSSQVQFTRSDITRDLSHNQVNSFYRDKAGFVWIATMNGLNRYDGYAYRHYYTIQGDSTSLNDNYIDRLFPYPGGYMLVITRQGGNLYNFSTDRFDQHWENQQRKLDLPETLPVKVIEDSKSCYWFLFPQGDLYRIGPTMQKAQKVVPAKTGSSQFTDVAEDPDGNIWLITNKGVLYNLDEQTLAIKYQSFAISNAVKGKTSPGYSVFPGIKNQCWVWLRNDPSGALLLKTGTGEVTHYTAKGGDAGKLQNNNVTGIVADPSGYIWITTDPGGLHLVNQQTGQLQYIPNNPEDPHSISQDAIISMYKDPQGLIWLGTYKKGLNYFNPNLPRFPLIKYDPARKNSLPYNDVNDFAEDAAGNFWIGTNGGGLLYYDRQKDIYKRYFAGPGSISSNVIVSLCIDHAGRLWIGSYYGGLDCFENGHFTNYHPDPSKPRSLADNNIWEIFEDSKQRLWVGTLRGGIHLYDSVTKDFTHYRGGPNSVQSDYNGVTIEDDKGNLWFGTSLGIDVLEAATHKFSHFAADKNKKRSLSNENIYTIFQDSKKRIWIGTREGLNLYRSADRSFITYTKKDGLPDNTIINILEDNKGYLWLSTYNGLSQVKVLDNKESIQLSCRNYNELNNLQGRDFNENAALKTSRGEMIFGGANGFNLFMPSTVEGPLPPAQVRFTGFDLFNKPVMAGEKYDGRMILSQSITNSDQITLAHNQNVFSVEFATLDFAHTEKTRFAYRLDGFNKYWLYTDAGVRKATFTNLDPGEYLLRVRTVYDNGELSPTETVLSINILPPWWLTYWAFFIYIILIIAALIAARRFILRRAKTRFAIELERKEAKRMHELDEMKIEFITNISHEFRTPLSLILAPLDKLQKTPVTYEQEKNFNLIQRNVRRLLNLVNQLLDFRKLDVQEHQFLPQPGNIVAFTKDICASFTDIAEKKNIQFQFNSDIEEMQILFDHDKLEKTLLNLLSNAYKFTPDDGKVNVTLKLEETKLGTLETNQYLLIEVKDTGIGIASNDLPKIFDRFHRNNMPGHIINQGSGIGLAIVKEFVQLHDGTVTVTSSPGTGSCFTVSLPVRAIQEKIIIKETGTEAVEEITSSKKVAAINGNRAGNRPLVLVVEDNDDFRQFLTESLQQYYRVTAVANGEEAWKYLQVQLPKLVVSDVMMPVMDGIELAQKMKKHPVTASVPILLLTARNAEEHQVAGLATGANDYIVKPFSLDVLLQKIRNQLKEQKRKPVPNITIATAAIPAENPEQRWLQEILAAAETNINNAEFSVKDLARLVNMSRAGLYKKMIGLTGKSPVEFITKVRMDRARQLLLQQQFTVAEVAYEVGFTDPKYFAKTFKKETGILPSVFASSQISVPADDNKYSEPGL